MGRGIFPGSKRVLSRGVLSADRALAENSTRGDQGVLNDATVTNLLESGQRW